MGVGRTASRSTSFTRGMELRGKYTLFAEGARGSLTKQLIARFELDDGREPQKYGIGLKEIWQVAPDKHRPGLVQHTLRLAARRRAPAAARSSITTTTNLVSVGFVVHLNYANPTLSPFDEFQRFKTHPLIARHLRGRQAARLWRARASPRAAGNRCRSSSFPGGALIGCAAGFVNVPRIKGSHNAMLSGMLAAEHVARGARRRARRMTSSRATRRPGAAPTSAAISGRCATSSRCGRSSARSSASRSAASTCGPTRFGFSLFGTLKHGKPDCAHAQAARRSRRRSPIRKPDGKLTFDRLSSVFLSNTNHEEDQPVHLRLADPGRCRQTSSTTSMASPSARYCPAGVYEWVRGGRRDPRFVINAQNCVHCKTCDIKDPNQNITWVRAGGRRRTELPEYVTGRQARLAMSATIRPPASMRRDVDRRLL